MNRVEIYRDDAGEFRWRRWTSGQISEASHQGYARKLTAVEFALKRNLDMPADRFIDLTRGRTVLRSVLVGRILGGCVVSETHTAVWNGFGWNLECHEADDASCHARFTCGCEAWTEYKVHDGRPVHLAYDSDRDIDRWHVGDFLPGWCNIAEWWDEGEGREHNGFAEKVRVPVSYEWTHDGPEFTARPPRVEGHLILGTTP